MQAYHRPNQRPIFDFTTSNGATATQQSGSFQSDENSQPTQPRFPVQPVPRMAWQQLPLGGVNHPNMQAPQAYQACQPNTIFQPNMQAQLEAQLRQLRMGHDFKSSLIPALIPNKHPACAEQQPPKPQAAVVQAIHPYQRQGRSGRKPRGYWDSLENVQSELRLAMSELGVEYMPSLFQLKKHGCLSLYRALYKHGGWRAVEATMNVPPRDSDSDTGSALSTPCGSEHSTSATPSGTPRGATIADLLN